MFICLFYYCVKLSGLCVDLWVFLRELIIFGFYCVIVFSCKGWCGFCWNILLVVEKNVIINYFIIKNFNKILWLFLCEENLCLYLDFMNIIIDICN